jgi:effector-binding domain-containing protein
MVATGMEHGAAESYDRMAELLGEQVKAALADLDPPQVLDLPAFKVARVHVVTPAAKIMTAMNEGLNELRGALAAQGVEPTGPWLTHHRKVPDGTFDFEICLPVASEVRPEGRVEMGEIRAARTARTTYRGDYAGLGEAWGRFMGWIDGQDVTTAPDLWEVYTVGPETSPNPADWRTQLNRPLA